jgi:hypothetical protein
MPRKNNRQYFLGKIIHLLPFLNSDLKNQKFVSLSYRTDFFMGRALVAALLHKSPYLKQQQGQAVRCNLMLHCVSHKDFHCHPSRETNVTN